MATIRITVESVSEKSSPDVSSGYILDGLTYMEKTISTINMHINVLFINIHP